MKIASLRQAALIAATACAALASLPASAQFAKPEDAVGYRKMAFKMIATHFSRVNAMAQGKVAFDAKAAQDNALVVAQMARLPFAAFPEGSGDLPRSEAKPEVWKESDKFKQATQKFLDEAAKLEAASKSGKLDDLKAAAGAVGQSCKGCHDTFKKKD